MANAAVRVHAEEAVVRGRDGRREHLALVAPEGRAREVVDQQLVGQAAQVDAEPGRQAHRDADAGHVGQAADDRVLLARSSVPRRVPLPISS